MHSYIIKIHPIQSQMSFITASGYIVIVLRLILLFRFWNWVSSSSSDEMDYFEFVSFFYLNMPVILFLLVSFLETPFSTVPVFNFFIFVILLIDFCLSYYSSFSILFFFLSFSFYSFFFFLSFF